MRDPAGLWELIVGILAGLILLDWAWSLLSRDRKERDNHKKKR